MVVVNVIDSNNHAPVFMQPLYQFSVSENELTGQMGHVVGHVLATDEDQGDNGRISYYITSRSGQDLFNMPLVCSNLMANGHIFYVFLTYCYIIC